jgi:uncharacterized coiled-coil protein SlyX
MGDESYIRDLEEMAEWLVAEQLDLLAQVEAQLRAVHHTMRRVEKLRNAKHRRTGPQLSEDQRRAVLAGLAQELAELDAQVTTQGTCCHAMLVTVAKMQQRMAEIRQASAKAQEGTDAPQADLP